MPQYALLYTAAFLYIYTYIQIRNMKTNSPTCLIAAQTARGVFTFSALVAALFTAGVVQASSVFELGGVVVRGDLNTADLIGEKAISQEQMQEFNLYDVGAALNTQPGVSISKGGPRGETTLSVRGFDSRQVPIFLDGIPQYVPYDGNVDLDRFTTFDLSEIRVAKGAASLLYGPNTLGGAVNLVTRKPTKEFEGDVRFGYATGNERMAAVNFGSNQGLWYFQGGLSWLEADKFPLGRGFSDGKKVPTDTGSYRENAHRRDKRASFKIGLTPNATDEYALGYSIQKGQKEQPIYVGDRGDNPRYWRWPYWDKESVYFISNTALGNDHDLKFRIYHDEYKNGLDMYKDASFAKHDPTSAYKDNTYGGAMEFVSRAIQNHDLHLALHYKHDKHKDGDIAYKDRTMSIAAEDLITLNDAWRLRVGLSHERRKSLDAGIWEKGSGNATNGVVEVMHDITDNTELYASAAYKTRFPTIKDRYSARMGRALPSPDLKSENARHFEIGARSEPWYGAKLDAAVFYSQVRDMIDTVTFESNMCTGHKVKGFCDQAQNVGKVRRHGIELGLEQRFSPEITAGINYTYLHNKNQTDPERRVRDIPEHKAFAYVNWTPSEQWSLIASMDAEKGRYYSYTQNKQDHYTQTAGFVTFGLKGVWSPRNDLSFEAGVRNLGDKNYEYKEGYPMAGRVWFAGATYRF